MVYNFSVPAPPFPGLRRFSYPELTLTEADLSEADLRANLTDAILTAAILSDTRLPKDSLWE